MIISASFKLIGGSSSIGIDDKFWVSNFLKGYSPYENTKYIMENLLDEIKSKKKHEIYFLTAEPFKYPRMVVNLIHSGKFYGHMSALCIKPDYSEEAQELLCIAADLVAKTIIVGENPALIQENVTAAVLIDLVQGNIKDRRTLSGRIVASYLRKSSVFQLINVDAAVLSNTSLRESIRQELSYLLPNATIFPYQDQLLVFLANKYSNLLTAELLEDFDAILRKIDGYAFISDEFDDLYVLEQHYMKNVRMRSITQIQHSNRISFYDDYKIVDMTLLASSNADVMDFTMYAKKIILDIWKYDKENHTEFIKTLWCYLDSKESLNATANRLFIHRNTVVYRLSRLKKLFGISFESFANNIQYYLSCNMCMLSDRMAGNVQEGNDAFLTPAPHKDGM